MRFARGALALVLLAVPLAAEPDEHAALPRWLLGKWCPVLPPGDRVPFGSVPADEVVEVAPGVRIAPDYRGPGEGCIVWSVEGARLMHGTQTMHYSGRNDSLAVVKIIGVEDSLRYEVWEAWDYRQKPVRRATLREVSSKPGELVFYQQSERWIRIRREEDTLVHEAIDEDSGDVLRLRYALAPGETIGPFEHVRIPVPPGG